MARLHPNVLKLRKEKRKGRRAYLTPVFGLIKVPRRVGQSDVPEDMRSLFNYRTRGNTFFDQEEKPRMFSAEKMQTIRRMAEENRIPDELTITVRRGGITKTIIKFCFQADYRWCFWVKEDWLNMMVYKSVEYHGSGAKDRAYFDLDHNRIPWLESAPINEKPPG